MTDRDDTPAHAQELSQIEEDFFRVGDEMNDAAPPEDAETEAAAAPRMRLWSRLFGRGLRASFASAEASPTT